MIHLDKNYWDIITKKLRWDVVKKRSFCWNWQYIRNIYITFNDRMHVLLCKHFRVLYIKGHVNYTQQKEDNK
jgi:hypothetical protein